MGALRAAPARLAGGDRKRHSSKMRSRRHVLSPTGLRAPLHGLAFALALALYGGATLPHLADFPLMGQDEPWIAAPAAKLATEGVYGDDLFAGYYGMEQRTYNFPPL